MSWPEALGGLFVATLVVAPVCLVVLALPTWLLSLMVGEAAFLLGAVAWLELTWCFVGLLYAETGVGNYRRFGRLNTLLLGSSTSLERLDQALKELPHKYARRLAADVEAEVHDLIDEYVRAIRTAEARDH